jgi:hypothetical protein
MRGPKILLIAEPPAGPKFLNHLRHYGEVTLVRAHDFTAIPQGTEWVLVMNGGPRGAAIWSAAGHVGAKCVSIPPGWAHAEPILDRNGFFKAAKLMDGQPALKQQPFAAVANLLTERKAREQEEVARKQREREEAERKAREATEKGMNPPPPPPTCEECGEDISAFVENGGSHTCAMLAPDPAPAPETEKPAPTTEFALREKAAAALVERGLRRDEKTEWLWMIFDRNPNLSIPDACSILRATSPDGRAIAWQEVSEIRGEVRKLKGLPVDVRISSKLARAVGYAADYAPTLLAKQDGGVEIPTPSSADLMDRVVATHGMLTPPVAPPAPPPVSTGYTIPLPDDVAAAVRLLREALDNTPEVSTFALTFSKGEKAKVKWRPDFEADVEF